MCPMSNQKSLTCKMARSTLFLLILIQSQASSPEATAVEPLWQQLIPRKKVAAQQNVDYTLTENQGPWLILAASFSGDKGQQQAHDLVMELRSRYSLPAFYYGMTFRFDDSSPGRGLDQYGGKIKRRLQRGDQVVEHAVLVGEFTTIDDPAGQKLLARIKKLQTDVLTSKDGERTAQSLTAVRKYHHRLKQKLGKASPNGPMSHAFFTRNPLLPREYFVPKGVDAEVAKWNQGKGSDYSLLKCPGKFSIKVATFRGRSTIKQASAKMADRRTRKATEDDPLVVAARKAHLLTVALREKGWEAYEFHDRYESYVTVGSFNAGRQLPSGKIVLPSREAQIIISTFGAASPNNVFNKPARQDKMLEKQRLEQFNRMQIGRAHV